MRYRFLSFVFAVSMLLPVVLAGQAVDNSVSAVDVESKARVQDPDHPDSALLPGGSNAWNDQPIMSRTPSGSLQRGPNNQGNQFSATGGMSSWGMPQTLATSGPNGQSVRPRAAQSAAKSLSLKLDMTMAAIAMNSGRSSTSTDDLLLALTDNQATRTSAALELRRLRQEAAKSSKSVRARMANPLLASADVASAGRWHTDQSSAYALAQKEHNSGVLLRYGFSDKNKPRRRHRKAHVLGSHDW